MTRTIRCLGAGAMAAALHVTPMTAQTREEKALDWSGVVAAGKTMVVRTLNGGVVVRAAAGDRASIVATKQWRRGDPATVRVEWRRVGGDDGTVIACALFRPDASCDETGYRGGRDRGGWRDDDDVSVSFVVEVPRGVAVVTSTVNGGLDIQGATSGIDAESVNGGITASTSGGPVRAHTVNGKLDVTMGGPLTSDVTFATVNGSVSVRIPETLDAELSMRTVNGEVLSELPLTVTGRINPKRLRTTLGKGGATLSVETVNGDVRLRRR